MSTHVTVNCTVKGKELVAEAALVALAQSGDRRSFEALAMPCQAPMIRWLTRLTRNRAIAEELLQESFYKAYVALGSFRSEARFSTWLASIVRNTYLAWRKSQQGEPEHTELDVDSVLLSESDPNNWVSHPLTPEEHLWQQQLSEVIKQSLDQMPEPLRRAFELRELEGLSYAEIADDQQIPVGTVRSRIHRVREAISDKLKELTEVV